MIEEIEWQQPGRYIDVKDKYDQWLVGLIIQAKNGYLRVRMDGWESKHDEYLPIGSPRVKPFRSKVRGYTGQKQHPGIRQHMKFTPQNHLKNLERFQQFCEKIDEKSEDQINQKIRGSHYFYIDFLLSLHTQSSYEKIKMIYDYFSSHFEFCVKYIKTLAAEQNIYQQFNNSNSSQRALMNSHFQIFDATTMIIEVQTRHKLFFKNHQQLISQVILPDERKWLYYMNLLEKYNYQEHFKKIWENIPKILEVFDQIKAGTYKSELPESTVLGYQPSFSFVYPLLRSLLHFFFQVQRLIENKGDKNLSVFIAQNLIKIADRIPVYEENEIDLEEFLKLCSKFHLRFRLKKTVESEKLLAKVQILVLNVYRKLIQTSSFERKLRGIKKIKEYLEKITADEVQKQYMIMMLKMEDFVEWIQPKQTEEGKKIGLFELIFGESEHQEVIRKGCELMLTLYQAKGTNFKQIQELIWNKCLTKSEAIKKTIYQFIQKLVPLLHPQQKEAFAEVITKMKFSDQADSLFFSQVLEQFIHKYKKGSATAKLLTFSYKKLFREFCTSYLLQNLKNYEQTDTQQQNFIKTLAMWSTDNDLLREYVEMVFLKRKKELYTLIQDLMIEGNFVSDYSEEESGNLLRALGVNFGLKMLAYGYRMCDDRDLGLEESSMNQLIQMLSNNCKQILSYSTSKKPYHEKLTKILEHNLTKILEIIELMQVKQFQFTESDLHEVCTAFYGKGDNQKYKELQLNILYKWLLKSEKVLFFTSLSNQRINGCLSSGICEIMFEKYLVNPDYIDLVNLTLEEYTIIYSFFLTINVEKNALEKIEHKFSKLKCYKTKDFNKLMGINQFWKIFNNCRNHEVIQQVIKHLLPIYLSFQTEKSHTTIQGIQKLLTRLEKIINDSKKRSNHRLVKYSLFFLQEAIIFMKQEHQKVPREFMINRNIFTHFQKRKLILLYGENSQEIQVSYGEQLAQLLKQASILFDIPIYSLNFYIVKPPSLSSLLPAAVKNKQPSLQLLPKYFSYLPLVSLLPSNFASADKIHTLKIEVAPNVQFEYLKQFFSKKLQEIILNILVSDSNAVNSRQCSEFAYNILIQIPTHLSQSQILQKLIGKMSDKNIQLRDHSIYYRMYFIRIFNSVTLNLCQKDFQGFKHFLIKYNQFFQQIFEQIKIVEITERIHLELLHEIFQGTKKMLEMLYKELKNTLESEHKFTVQSFLEEMKLNTSIEIGEVLRCLRNALEFACNEKKIKGEKDWNRTSLMLYGYSLKICGFLTKEYGSLMLDIFIETGHFTRIIEIIFEELPAYRQFFVKIFGELVQEILEDPNKNCLKPENQQKLFMLIFGQIYHTLSRIHSESSETDSSTFNLFKNFIKILSEEKISDLVLGVDSFYRKQCLETIKKQSDPNRETHNTYFQGHLQIILELIHRRPTIIDQQLLRVILFQCLIYDSDIEKANLFKIVKCRNESSIKYSLLILQEIIINSKQSYGQILETLLKVQQKVEYRRNAASWTVNLNNEYKSVTGYVGLQNPGCICYMNSLLQVLFNNKKFREQVIRYQPKQIETENSVLMAMKKLFINLDFSDHKHISSLIFAKSLKNKDNKPLIKLYEQMDIEEFSSILFDKIQKQLLTESQAMLPSDNLTTTEKANGENEHFIKNIFEGKYSNEIISQQCQHSSERQEHFISMQLDVKPSLDLALKSLVEGEILDGQNKYYCEKCDKKVRALKRLSIKQLPDSLLVCLKRFEYNFEYDMKIKVNSYCEFSDEFSFLPYTQEYLNNREELIKDKVFYEYRLKGVVVHAGSSDSGHYYAFLEGDEFIDENNNVKKWYQFNDSYVNQFDKENLPEQAYGNKQQLDPKVKNAYMLVYQRKKAPLTLSVKGHKLDIDDQYSKHTKSTQQLIKEVKLENQQIHITELFFDSSYKKWVQYLVFDEKLVSEKATELFFSFIIHFSIREQNPSQFCEQLLYLQELLKKKYDEFGKSILMKMFRELGKIQVLFEFFWQCKIKEKSQTLVDFFINLLNFSYSKMDDDCFGQEIKELPKQAKYFHKMLGTILKSIMKNSIEYGLTNQAMYFVKKLIRVSHQNDFPLFEIVGCLNICENVLLLIKDSKSEEKDWKLQSSKFIQLWETYSQEQYKDLGQEMQEENQPYTSLNLSKVSSISKDSLADFRNKFGLFGEIYRALNEMYIIRRERVNKLSKDPQEQHKLFINTNKNFSQIFNQLTEQTIQSMIQNCRTCKCVRGLSAFFVTVIDSDFQKTSKVILGIKRGLRALQGIKFRSFLLLTYYLILMNDCLARQRIQILINFLEQVYTDNLKYFSETDLIFQWIMKIANASQVFAESLRESDLLAELSIEKSRQLKPDKQLLKKQKIASYERLNNLMHELIVSNKEEKYEELKKMKLKFLHAIANGTYVSANMPSEPSLQEDEEYDGLVNQTIQIYEDNKWKTVKVKQQVYNLLTVTIDDEEKGMYWGYDQIIRKFKNQQSNSLEFMQTDNILMEDDSDQIPK